MSTRYRTTGGEEAIQIPDEIKAPGAAERDERDDEPTQVTALLNDFDEKLETSKRKLAAAESKASRLRQVFRRRESYPALMAALGTHGDPPQAR